VRISDPPSKDFIRDFSGVLLGAVVFTAAQGWTFACNRKSTVLISDGTFPPEESSLNGSPYLREVTSESELL
jgi:hypothetical protein